MAEAHGFRKPRGRPPKITPATPRLGVLYPFKLSKDMREAIERGWKPNPAANIEVQEDRTTEKDKLQQGVTNLINAKCTVIVAFGGLAVHNAVIGHKTNTLPLFSMAGRKPKDWRHGGITVHTPLSNQTRIDFLIGKGLSPNQIALYRPKMGLESGADSVFDLEQRKWNEADWGGSVPGPIIDSTGKFDADFNGGTVVPAAIRGLIVSASPSFLGSMTRANPADGSPMPDPDSLVIAANKWVTMPSTNRHVVYHLKNS
jgi:hypothetical protein